MKSFNIAATKNLPDHNFVLDAILNFFQGSKGVVGSFVSGSVATETMDEESDLDIGIVVENMESLENIWQSRWDWSIAPWFHRFDADHIKPYFVVYLFDPTIKADINFYLSTVLPPAAGGPYKIVWDNSGKLEKWQAVMAAEGLSEPDWTGAIHEDERFWAWIFWLYGHVNRGEYYDAALEFPTIRDIFEQWCARLGGEAKFDSRKVEKSQFYKELTKSDLFPKPERDSLKAAMEALIQEYSGLRKRIDDEQSVKWNTNTKTIKKIRSLVASI